MLQALFSSKTRVSLLWLFLKRPNRRYYLREISRMLDESLTPIRRELLNLKKIGLLTDMRVANIIYYRANKDFLLFEELQKLIAKAGNSKDKAICVTK